MQEYFDMQEFALKAIRDAFSGEDVLRKLGACILHQTCGVLHPLTCGGNSHKEQVSLIPVLQKDLKTIIWECPICDYKQERLVLDRAVQS